MRVKVSHVYSLSYKVIGVRHEKWSRLEEVKNMNIC